MNTGAGVADLRASHERHTINFASSGSRTASTLGDVFINFTVLVRTGTESLDRRVDEPRIERMYFLPRKTHAVDCTRREVFNHDVGCFDKLREDLGNGWSHGIDST